MHRTQAFFLHRHAGCSHALSRGMKTSHLTINDHRRQVGYNLRQVIAALGITQVEAAGVMGVPKNQLGNWLRGEAYPRHYEVYLFCRRYGVTADWIYLGDPSGLPGRIAEPLLAGALPEIPEEPESQAAEKPSRSRRRIPRPVA